MFKYPAGRSNQATKFEQWAPDGVYSFKAFRTDNNTVECIAPPYYNALANDVQCPDSAKTRCDDCCFLEVTSPDAPAHAYIYLHARMHISSRVRVPIRTLAHTYSLRSKLAA